MESGHLRKYNWHVLYLKSKTEKKVNDEIRNRGIECFLPLKTSKRIWSDRIKLITEPLLPSYIFVYVSSAEYYDVLMVSGVLRYVCFENKPAIISTYQINLLKLFVENHNDKIEISSNRIKKGNFVKIKNGPLKNIVGEVLEMRGTRNLLLRFDQLGYILQVDISTNEVEVLEGIYPAVNLI